MTPRRDIRTWWPRRVAMAASRSVRVDADVAFERVLPMPLPRIFSRRHLVFPPVRTVGDQHGPWGEPGQTRVVHTSDGGSMSERLDVVDPPRCFTYRLDHIAGPMRALADRIDGAWHFEQHDAGTTITWTWQVRPRPVARLVMPLFVRMWTGYARKALSVIEQELTGDSGDARPQDQAT